MQSQGHRSVLVLISECEFHLVAVAGHIRRPPDPLIPSLGSIHQSILQQAAYLFGLHLSLFFIGKHAELTASAFRKMRAVALCLIFRMLQYIQKHRLTSGRILLLYPDTDLLPGNSAFDADLRAIRDKYSFARIVTPQDHSFQNIALFHVCSSSDALSLPRRTHENRQCPVSK